MLLDFFMYWMSKITEIYCMDNVIEMHCVKTIVYCMENITVMYCMIWPRNTYKQKYQAEYNDNIIIIIIIAFKGAIRDFLQSPHSAANCLQHVRSSGPGATVCKSRATHVALITCKCHVTCRLVRRDSSAIKFDRVEIAFI